MRVEDGAVQRAIVGDGTSMENTPDHPSVKWIVNDFGWPADEELPLNYYL